jgi:hypothetical protein
MGIPVNLNQLLHCPSKFLGKPVMPRTVFSKWIAKHSERLISCREHLWMATLYPAVESEIDTD